MGFFQQREISPMLAGYVAKVLGELLKNNFYSIWNYFLSQLQELDLVFEHCNSQSAMNNVIKRLIFTFMNETESGNLELQLDKQ